MIKLFKVWLHCLTHFGHRMGSITARDYKRAEDSPLGKIIPYVEKTFRFCSDCDYGRDDLPDYLMEHYWKFERFDR